MPKKEDDEIIADDDYIAGDSEIPRRGNGTIAIAGHTNSLPSNWALMSVDERIAVIRWLRHGSAKQILLAFARNPKSAGLGSVILEALAGGCASGWRLRVASASIGGAPKKADKALLVSLGAAITNNQTDAAHLAREITTVAEGTRSRKGPISDPMQIAMVGFYYYWAYDQLAESGNGGAEQARSVLHRLYGRNLGDKNIQRLITAFNKAGTDTEK